FGIDGSNNSINRLALLEHLAGVFDSTRPRDVRYVHQAIHAIFYLDESAKIRQIANATLDARSDVVTVAQSLPRIRLHLFHTEADAARLWIHAQDLNLDGVARVDDFAGMLHPFRPAHLGNVHQALDPWF